METKSVAHKLDAKERTEDVRLKELAPFSKMLLSESVRKGLQAAGFMYPTVIQATAIPVGKSGLDLLVQSKSGTGKTLIFSTIVLEFYKSDVREPQSLIVAPTREIAVQIEEILNQIGKYCAGFRAVCVIGGMDVVEDRKRLQGAKSVVGTPGRILHLIQNEVLNTSQMSLLVLDEADKMYTHTFRQDLQRIRKALPNRKQTIACSATFVDNLDQELAKIMKNPLLISTEEKATLLVGIKQFVYELPEQKTSILEMQLKLEALRRRQKKPSLPTTEVTPAIKRKRRGGVLQKLKREKAILLRLVNANPPPSWNEASRMWKKINEIGFLIEQDLKRRQANK